MKERSQVASALSGMAGSAGTLLFYPLEMLKVHMIVSDGHSKNAIPYYRNAYHALKSIYESQGFLQLYRGCHINIFSTFAWSLYFFFYEKAKTRYSAEFKETHNEAYRFLVAAEAAVVSRVITNPLWVIKTRIMLQNSSQKWYGETFEAIRKTWKVEGLRGFAAGLTPGLVLCSSGAFQLYFYEHLKESIGSESSWKTGVAGGVSKLLSSSLLYPMQTVMVRLQQEQYSGTIAKRSVEVDLKTKGERIFSGFLNCIRSTYTHEGLRGFYRGLTVSLVRILPSNALFFMLYEKSYSVFSRYI